MSDAPIGWAAISEFCQPMGDHTSKNKKALYKKGRRQSLFFSSLSLVPRCQVRKETISIVPFSSPTPLSRFAPWPDLLPANVQTGPSPIPASFSTHALLSRPIAVSWPSVALPRCTKLSALPGPPPQPIDPLRA